MRFKYDELIDRYNYGQLSEQEKELVFVALELYPDFREEFCLYLKMKHFNNIGSFCEVKCFMQENCSIQCGFVYYLKIHTFTLKFQIIDTSPESEFQADSPLTFNSFNHEEETHWIHKLIPTSIIGN